MAKDLTTAASVSPPPLRGRPGRQWWLAVVVTALIALSSVDKQIMALLVQPVKADLGLSDTQMSLLLGLAFALTYTLSSIPAGYLADRISRRRIIAAGAVGWSVMTMARGVSTTYAAMFLARVGVGAGEGAVMPSAFSMTKDGVAPERRGRAFAIMQSANSVGAGLAVILGAAVVAYFTRLGPVDLLGFTALKPWQMVFIVIGLIGIPLALLMYTVKEPGREPPAEGQSAASLSDAGRFVLKHWRIYLPLGAFMVLNGVHGSTYGAWAASMMQRMWGYSAADVGRTYGPLILIGAPLGLFFTGWLIDALTKRGRLMAPVAIAAAAAGLSGINATFIPLSPNQVIFWSLFVVQVLITGAPMAAAHIILANVTPSHWVGKVAGLKFLLAGVFGMALGPTLAAGIGDLWFPGPRSLMHGIAVLEAVNGVLALVATVYLWRAMKYKMTD